MNRIESISVRDNVDGVLIFADNVMFSVLEEDSMQLSEDINDALTGQDIGLFDGTVSRGPEGGFFVQIDIVSFKVDRSQLENLRNQIDHALWLNELRYDPDATPPEVSSVPWKMEGF